MLNMNRIFDKFSQQTGAGNKLSDLQKRIIEVISRYKHAKADVVGSSSGKGIQESGEYVLNKLLCRTLHMTIHYFISCLMVGGLYLDNVQLACFWYFFHFGQYRIKFQHGRYVSSFCQCGIVCYYLKLDISHMHWV